MRGLPDLLERVDSPSRLGAFRYRPVEIKHHRAVTSRDKHQLACYAWMLEPLVVQHIDAGAVWLSSGQMAHVDLAPTMRRVERLRGAMLAVRDGRLETVGLRCSECGICPWHDHCREEWLARNCIGLVRGVSGHAARRLWEERVRTVEQLASASTTRLAGCGLNQGAATEIFLHAQARALGRPIQRKPIAAMPGRQILYYDIETHGDTVYLHGLLKVDEAGSCEERSFLAKSPSEEVAAWHAFLDHLARFEGAVIFTWTDFERGYAEALWARHRGNRRGWNVLSSGMVDLYQLVRDHFALPVASYSLKEVAPVFGFHWHAGDAGGLNAEAWYGEWLEHHDPTLLAKIVEYNLDDVRAMEVVYRELAYAAVAPPLCERPAVDEQPGTGPLAEERRCK